MTSGSPVLEVLQALEAKGVHLVICSTCLKHYGLEDQDEPGSVSPFRTVSVGVLIDE